MFGGQVEAAVVAQGRQLPSFLRTMWSGEDHGESERRMMPAASSLRNSASAVRSLSGSRRRALAKTGLPVVSTECLTPWRGLGVPLPSPTLVGNAASRVRTAVGMQRTATEKRAAGSAMGRSVLASSRRRATGSMSRLWVDRKSRANTVSYTHLTLPTIYSV